MDYTNKIITSYGVDLVGGLTTHKLKVISKTARSDNHYWWKCQDCDDCGTLSADIIKEMEE